MESSIENDVKPKNSEVAEEAGASAQEIKKPLMAKNSSSDSSDNDEDYDDDDGRLIDSNDSDTASVYSTTDQDIIRQRRKEKSLKKRLLVRALRNEPDNDQASYTSFLSHTEICATVGTSKISDKSFRATKNLERLYLPLAPYITMEAVSECDEGVYVEEPVVVKPEKKLSKLDRMHREANDLKISRTVTNKWKQKTKKSTIKAKEYVPPTYQLEPKEKVRVNAIMNKIKNVFEVLLKKNEKYDIKYTPKFTKISCELIKDYVKTFKYDRYKIIVHIVVLQKVISQSCLITSACLWNADTDKKICLKLDTKTFYAICYIFLVYRE